MTEHSEHDDRTTEYAQNIVVFPSDHLSTVAAVAMASTVRLCESDIDEHPWKKWLAGPFAKVVRRVTRSARLEGVVATAERLPSSMVCVGEARAYAFDPMLRDDLPHAVSRLQVSGLDLRERPGIQPRLAPQWIGRAQANAPLVLINGRVDMTTGKTAAQVAHAVMGWALRLTAEQRRQWVLRPSLLLGVDDLEALPPELDPVRIIDAGRTEIAPDTETVRAWQVGAVELEYLTTRFNNVTRERGAHVSGRAQPGDRVTYFDIANQDGTVWEVVDVDGSDFVLMTDDGRVEHSDLRQTGWTFA
ncbi:peptidyl-tRNA hydrolase [Pseudoclavibacter soli]|uniref:peptidyl-tRNA hydrolase n=1 Tax=Pseudoclavibacter soli TaxID=452623 RepID=UPI00040B7D45|nr:peptidyl-tRNA hydrolase [Pseudoclavibacter soli]